MQLILLRKLSGDLNIKFRNMNKILTLKALYNYIVNYCVLHKVPVIGYGMEVTNNKGLSFFLRFTAIDRTDELIYIDYDVDNNKFGLAENLDNPLKQLLSAIISEFGEYYNENEIILDRSFLNDILGEGAAETYSDV